MLLGHGRASLGGPGSSDVARHGCVVAVTRVGWLLPSSDVTRGLISTCRAYRVLPDRAFGGDRDFGTSLPVETGRTCLFFVCLVIPTRLPDWEVGKKGGGTCGDDTGHLPEGHEVK